MTGPAAGAWSCARGRSGTGKGGVGCGCGERPSLLPPTPYLLPPHLAAASVPPGVGAEPSRTLVQGGQRVAFRSRSSIWQKGHVFVAGLGVSLMNSLLIRHATKPMMKKFRIALRMVPTWNGIGPGVTHA